MELWDLYDRDRMKTGETMARGSGIPDGLYRLVVHVCVFNARGEMLIQQRQPFKEGWPNMWDVTVGGNATAGDSSQSAAEREVLEEIGLRLDLRGVRPHLTVNFEQGFDDYYLVDRDVDISALLLQHEEVQAVRWATAEEILRMMDQGVFIPYQRHLIGLLFDMRKGYGSHSRRQG